MGIKRKRNWVRWIVTGIIAAGITGYIAYKVMRPAAATYKTVKAQTGNITTYYSFSGNVASKNRHSVISDRIMQIKDIHVAEGDNVEEGTVLITTTAGEEIRSKINGEVVNLQVQESTQLSAGIKLMDIVDYEDLEVVFNVDEYDVGALESGKEATVKINALDKEIHGKIRTISKDGQIMNGVTFFTASMDIELDEGIRTGMSAEVRLVSEKVQDVVILPMNVIQFDDQNQPYVFKQDQDQSVVRANIETGINDGTTVEIKSGVLAGENILYRQDTSLEKILFPENGKNAKVHLGGMD